MDEPASNASRLTVRVVAPHTHYGLWLVFIIIGLGFGSLMGGLFMNIQFGAAAILLPCFAVIPIGIYLAVITVIGLQVGKICRHWKWLMVAGMSFGFAVALPLLSYIIFSQPAIMAGVAWTDVLLLAAILVIPAFAAAFAFLSIAQLNTMRWDLSVQDGTLCNYCGYPVGRGPSTLCPECGSPRDCSTPHCDWLNSIAWMAWKRRHAITMMLIVVLILAIGFLVWHHRPFHAALNRLAVDNSYVFSTYAPTDDAHIPPRALYISCPIEDDASKGLVVIVWRPSAFSRPIMQVRLGGRIYPSGKVFRVLDGKPRIILNLDPNDTATVLNDGISEKCIKCLIETAQKENWVPPPPLGVWDPNHDVIVTCP